jgi:hypothetical protein
MTSGQSNLKSLLGLCFIFLLSFPAIGRSAPIAIDPAYGVIEFAENVGSPSGMTLSGAGDLFLTDYAGWRVIRISAPFQSGSNPPLVVASNIAYPTDLAFASDGRLLVTSSTGPGSNIVQVAPDGSTSVFASGFSYPTSIIAVGNQLYVTPGGDGTLVRVDLSGNVYPFLSGFSAPNGPYGVSYDGSTTLYFVDHGTGRIFKTDLAGNVTLLGTLTPFGVSETAVAPDGTVFVNDLLAATVYRIDSQGNITPFATGFSGKSIPLFAGPGPMVVDHIGNLFVGDGNSVWKFTPPPGVALNNFLNEIIRSGLPESAKTGIVARLSRAIDILGDSNSANDTAACGILGSVTNEIRAMQKSGKLSSFEADLLQQSADAVGTIMGCQ